jgi:nucleotide-binding universal stress UspA family protein
LQREAVEAAAARIAKQWNIAATGIERIDFPASGIAKELNRHEFSFVVMGMRKHSEAGRLFGSSATAKIHNANYAVLIIPEDVSYHKPQTILLATDLEYTLDHKNVEVLRRISDQLDIVLHIVKVNEEKRLWDVSERNVGLQLIKNLPGVKYDWHFPVGENVRETILEEAKIENADWVVVAPHQLAWYEELFHKSVSRKLAFTTDRPLLILPANTTI